MQLVLLEMFWSIKKKWSVYTCLCTKRRFRCQLKASHKSRSKWSPSYEFDFVWLMFTAYLPRQWIHVHKSHMSSKLIPTVRIPHGSYKENIHLSHGSLPQLWSRLGYKSVNIREGLSGFYSDRWKENERIFYSLDIVDLDLICLRHAIIFNRLSSLSDWIVKGKTYVFLPNYMYHLIFATYLFIATLIHLSYGK